MERVAAECDLGILNGTHTTTANLLVAGKPTLHFPLYLEQHLTAQKVEELGAGFCVTTASPENVRTKLSLLLNFDSCDEEFRSPSSGNQQGCTTLQKQRAIGLQKSWLCRDLFLRREITVEVKEGI
jgi:UDP:flavonoid glycosyltransferase YjiC (YdhE family)